MNYDSEHFDDLTWPVTNGDCAVLIVLSVGALIGLAAMAAWILANIWSIG